MVAILYPISSPLNKLYQDRILYAMQYFHGTLATAKSALRAMAMLWNFHPYCRKVQALEPHSLSPFEDLNGFRASRQLVTQSVDRLLTRWARHG